MRSIKRSSSPIEGAATMAMRSNGPLTECNVRTSSMRRSAASIGADLRGSSVINTWARTRAASTSSLTLTV